MSISNSRTEEFNELVKKLKSNKNNKNHKNSSSSSKSSSLNENNEKHKENCERKVKDPWTKEANLIARHVEELISFLSNIRRAYIDPSSNNSNSKFNNNNDQRKIDVSKGVQGLSNVRWFSEKEKDEIDILVNVGLRKSIDGVRALEAAEKSRQSQKINQNSNGLSRFLGINLNSEDVSMIQFDSHRSSIIWFLNQRLTELSKIVKDQQEVRAKKKFERVMKSGLSAMVNVQGTSSSIKKNNLTKSQNGNDLIPEIYKPKISNITLSGEEEDNEMMGYERDSIRPIEKVLTDLQIQQFESESSTLSRLNEQTIASIKKTESSLLEISNLQTELVNHLTQQNELIDQLWDDSIVSNSKIKQGNVQLFKANEANKESRIMLLVFLLGASFALLFLDYMAP